MNAKELFIKIIDRDPQKNESGNLLYCEGKIAIGS
jgi:hypothetical protein